jgi:hypothetical protein
LFVLLVFLIPFSAVLAVAFLTGAYNIRYVTFVLSGQESCPRVWLISVMYRSNPVAVKQSKDAQQTLEQGHVRIEERHYFWIDLDLYMPKTH